MKLAASKVDFRTGPKVGAKVVFAAPVVVTVVEEGEGGVVVLAVALVGPGAAVVGTEHKAVLFTTLQLLTVELSEQ